MIATDIGALTPIRWKSLGGVGIVLLLLYTAMNVVAAIIVPWTLETRGGQGGGNYGVVIAKAPEEHMLGMSYERLYAENPKLDKLLVNSMLGMCSMMMAMAIAYFGVVWFGARRGARWAAWVVLISGVIWVPYYFIIAADMARFGAPDTTRAAWMVAVFAMPAVLGSIFVLLGTKRT